MASDEICRLSLGFCLALSAFPAESQDRADQGCDRYFKDGPVVEQTLFMHQEGARHRLRVPLAYLEDPWDRVQGGVHEAQLFRVTTDGFEPVTRKQSSMMMRAGNHGFYSFLLQDLIPLEDLLDLELRLWARDKEKAFPDFETSPRRYFQEVDRGNGLAQMVPVAGIVAFRDMFVASAEDGRLDATFTCYQIGAVAFPSCYENTRIQGIDVQISYRRTELVHWKRLEQQVAAFVGCVTQDQ